MVKPGLVVMSAAALLGLCASALMAQQQVTKQELTNLDRFLKNHPEVSQRLAHDPNLLNSPVFVSSHPGLETFLKNNPGMKEELQMHPEHFMDTEGRRR